MLSTGEPHCIMGTASLAGQGESWRRLKTQIIDGNIPSTRKGLKLNLLSLGSHYHIKQGDGDGS